MEKGTNCKHGLNEKQELEARKLRKRLEEGDVEVLKEFLDMFLKYVKESKGSYIDYVKSKNPIYYSALIREMERLGPKSTYDKILNC